MNKSERNNITQTINWWCDW